MSSDSDAVGEEFAALETADNSGIFALQFQTSHTVASGLVHVSVGDEVTVEYEDEYPASFGLNGTGGVDFQFIAQVISSGGGGSGGGGGLMSPPSNVSGSSQAHFDAIVTLPTGPAAINQTANVLDLSPVRDFLRILDNTAAALGADQNLAYEAPYLFSVRSLDPECNADHGVPSGCTIFGSSPSITANVDTFSSACGCRIPLPPPAAIPAPMIAQG